MKSRTTTSAPMLLFIALALAGAALVGAPSEASAEKLLKLATLAPKGSDWEKSFRAADKIIQEKTGGNVKLRIYAGGVMGDEKAMVRKMRTGQIDSGAVTGVGLGDINQQLLVLQLPLLFQNYKQLDYVRDKMSGTFSDLLAQKGFVLLTWGDVGFQYLFSNAPVSTVADARATKMWVWDSDPISKEVMAKAKINATELGVPDVLPGLTTGLVDAFLNSPYGAVALQWSGKANHIMDIKLAFVIGGVVISKKSWDGLSADEQKIVREAFATEGQALIGKIRKANASALNTLVKKQGYKPTAVGNFPEWKKLADDVRASLTGKLFDKKLVDELLGHLKAAR